MPFDENGMKACGFKNFPIGWQRVPLGAHVKAWAVLKAGESDAKYTAAFQAVKAAYNGWEALSKAEKDPTNKAAHAKFLAIGKGEYNTINQGMQKYGLTLKNAIALRQNALNTMTPWDADFVKFQTVTPQLLADAKVAFAKKDKVLAAKVIADAVKADKRVWLDQCYKWYETNTSPWRTGKTGLDPNDLAAHVAPMSTKVYKIGNNLNKARNLIQDFTAAYNTAKAT